MCMYLRPTRHHEDPSPADEFFPRIEEEEIDTTREVATPVITPLWELFFDITGKLVAGTMIICGAAAVMIGCIGGVIWLTKALIL